MQQTLLQSVPPASWIRMTPRMPRSPSARSDDAEASRQTPPARADAKKSKGRKTVGSAARAERNKSCRGLRDQVKTMEWPSSGGASAGGDQRPPGDAGTYQTEAGEIAGRAGQVDQVYLSRLNREWEEALTSRKVRTVG